MYNRIISRKCIDKQSKYLGPEIKGYSGNMSMKRIIYPGPDKILNQLIMLVNDKNMDILKNFFNTIYSGQIILCEIHTSASKCLLKKENMEDY